MNDETEDKTRKIRIDPMIIAAGWNIASYDKRKCLNDYNKCAIKEYPTESGEADYALCAGSKILGVIEAKKEKSSTMSVLSQAERYARGIIDSPFNFSGYRVPFLYSSNGKETWYHDIRHNLNRSRQISGFHTQEALIEKLNYDFEKLSDQFFTIPDNMKMRPYQCEACDAIGNAIADRKRAMLVAMATGTGKTFTVVNLAYRLMKAGVAKRVLFLVDRRALAAQAIKAFSSYGTEQGLKFDKTYEVYSQTFQKGDIDEDDTFNPNLIPEA